MSDNDVTSRLRLLDEFSGTTTKYLGELRKVEGGSRQASQAMAGGFGSVTSKLQELESIGVPGVGRLASAFGTASAAQGTFLGASGPAIAGFVAAGVAVGAVGKVLVQAASEGEQAEVRLTSALKASGNYTAQALESVKWWSTGMLNAKGVSDELAMSLVGQGATMGLTIEQSKRFVSAAADMESIVGSTAGAFEQLARASTGDERALMMLGKQFGIAKTEGLSFEQMLVKIEKKTSGFAAAQVDTFAGSWKLLKDQLMNVAEAAGGPVIGGLTKLWQGLGYVLDNLTGVREELAKTAELDALHKTMKDLGLITSETVAEHNKWWASVMALRPAVETLDVTLARSIGNAKISAASWGDTLAALEKDYSVALDSMKKKQTEFEEWAKAAADRMAEGVKAKETLSRSGATGGEIAIADAKRMQHLLAEAEAATGDTRIKKFSEYRDAYLKWADAELTADRAMNAKITENNAEAIAAIHQQNELEAHFRRQEEASDLAAFEAGLAAKREAHGVELDRIQSMIEEADAKAGSKITAEMVTAKNEAGALQERIATVKADIATIGADIASLDAILKDEKTLSINTERAKDDMQRLLADVQESDRMVKEARDFGLETRAAMVKAADLRKQIDLLFPAAGLLKTVIIEYKTKASPIRPFGEGMDEIKKRMESLPTSGGYVVQAAGMGGATRGASSGLGGGINATFHTTITGAGGTSAPVSAKAVDADLATLWRSNRSALRHAMETAS